MAEIVVFLRTRTSFYKKPKDYVTLSYRVIYLEINLWLATPVLQVA